MEQVIRYCWTHLLLKVPPNKCASFGWLARSFQSMTIYHTGRRFKTLMLKICVNSGLCPLSSPQPLKLPGVLAAIPVSGCHQAGAGAGSHRDSPQLHHRAQLRPGPPRHSGLSRLLAALSVIRVAATAAVSYRARRVDTRNTRVSSTTAPDTTASLTGDKILWFSQPLNQYTGVWWGPQAEYCGQYWGQVTSVITPGPAWSAWGAPPCCTALPRPPLTCSPSVTTRPPTRDPGPEVITGKCSDIPTLVTTTPTTTSSHTHRQRCHPQNQDSFSKCPELCQTKKKNLILMSLWNDILGRLR